MHILPNIMMAGMGSVKLELSCDSLITCCRTVNWPTIVGGLWTLTGFVPLQTNV